jgi:hypothetical protein
MTTDANIAERLERLERQMAQIAGTARAVGELRDEMAPRVSEAIQALIRQLADVEADFQLEDLLLLVKKLMRNVRNLSFALDQLKNLIDFALTAEPLLKSSVPQFIQYLDELERDGVWRWLSLGLDVLRRVGSTYTAAEMHQIGDGAVRLVGILKTLCTGNSLDLMERAAGLPDRLNLAQATELSPGAMLRALGDAQLRQGLSVALELTRGLAQLRA